MLTRENPPRLHGEHIKAARALCQRSQVEIAHHADMSVESIKRYEAIRGPINASPRSIRGLISAFHHYGVIFIEDERGVSVCDVASAGERKVAPVTQQEPVKFDQHSNLLLNADAIPFMISSWDLNCRFQSGNSQFFSFFKLKKENCEGLTKRDLLGHMEYHASDGHLRAVLLGSDQVFIRRGFDANGDMYVAQVSYKPSLDEAGSICGFVSYWVMLGEAGR